MYGKRFVETLIIETISMLYLSLYEIMHTFKFKYIFCNVCILRIKPEFIVTRYAFVQPHSYHSFQGYTNFQAHNEIEQLDVYKRQEVYYITRNKREKVFVYKKTDVTSFGYGLI